MKNRRNCYEILGLARGTSVDSIRRSYRRLSHLFEPGNPTLCGLYDEADARALLAEVRHAYRVLMDPTARREHDNFLYPAAMTAEMSIDAQEDDFPLTDVDPGEDCTDLALPEGGEITPGRQIKTARQRMGLTLEDIAERTKIAIFTLRCLEDEHYGDLPPTVYVRGFLQQVCALLRFDDQATQDEFLRRYTAFQKQKEDGFG